MHVPEKGQIEIVIHGEISSRVSQPHGRVYPALSDHSPDRTGPFDARGRVESVVASNWLAHHRNRTNSGPGTLVCQGDLAWMFRIGGEREELKRGVKAVSAPLLAVVPNQISRSVRRCYPPVLTIILSSFFFPPPPCPSFNFSSG